MLMYDIVCVYCIVVVLSIILQVTNFFIIPKSLDSEYKEYERLCKEEVGKVGQTCGRGVKLEDLLNFHFYPSRVA